MERAVINLVGPERFQSRFKENLPFFSQYGPIFRNSKVITVSGTNGKGESCFFLESLLLRAGFRVALWTSPHLIHFTERIRCER